jgi:hypothetical protein
MDEKIEQFSPDKKFKLTFYDFDEPRMGMSVCRFSLINLQTNELIEFNPLRAIATDYEVIAWSDNKDFFSLSVVNPPESTTIKESFFIYDLIEKRFSQIYFDNCWVLTGKCHDDFIEIAYKEDQIPERIEHIKYPTKKFTKPTTLQFKFSELSWACVTALEQFNGLNQNAIIHKLQPIDNGWNDFKGQLPKTTEVLVWELRQFAEYGDVQSIIWLAEIEDKTPDINYWVNASRYLGFKIRGN